MKYAMTSLIEGKNGVLFNCEENVAIEFKKHTGAVVIEQSKKPNRTYERLEKLLSQKVGVPVQLKFSLNEPTVWVRVKHYGK